MKKMIALMLSLFALLSLCPIIAAAETAQTPCIVNTRYETDEVVIADIIATKAPYYADNTGNTDCTAAIQSAIDDCAAKGGGTVFLPAGKYRLTGNIKIKQFVTLMGDWQDPDIGTDYGTIIIADVKSEDIMSPGLITVGASAGAVGLTVWYPDQSIENVKPYPFTFYIEGNADYMLQTVKNCTLLNSYRGIGASSECENGIYQCHEMLTIENVKGTCLFEGLSAYNSADVDTVKTLYLLNKYWAEAGEDYNAPDIDKLNAYTRADCTAMVLGDLEWPELCDIKISDCKFGICFRKGIRASFSGTFADLSITDCDYGIYVNDGAIGIRGVQWGISVFNGTIEGTKKAIYDSGLNYLGLTNVEIKGEVSANNFQNTSTDLCNIKPDYSHKHAKPAERLFIAELDRSGKTDISSGLQLLLDEAGAGGGIVYLPGGLYRLDKPLTVPAGVELRGASSVAARCQRGNSGGTLIISYCGYSEDSSPLITLGESSGISGIRIDYPKNNPTDNSGSYYKTSPAVYGNSDGAYIINSCITLASRGVLIENADNVYIKKLAGCSLENMITLRGCSDSYIEGCLQNATCVVRNGYGAFDIPELQGRVTETDIFTFVFEPITRKTADYLILEGSDNITVFNSFIYGGRSFLVEDNSSSVLLNVGCDGSSKDTYTFNMNGGNTTVLNSMRSTYDGQQSTKLYSASEKAVVRIFNTQAVDLIGREYPVIKNVAQSGLSFSDRILCLLQPLLNVIYRLFSAIPGYFGFC